MVGFSTAFSRNVGGTEEALASSPWQSSLSLVLFLSLFLGSSLSFPAVAHEGGLVVDHVVVRVAVLAAGGDEQQHDQHQQDDPTQAHQGVGGDPEHGLVEGNAGDTVAGHVCCGERALDLRDGRAVSFWGATERKGSGLQTSLKSTSLSLCHHTSQHTGVLTHLSLQ